MKSYHSGLTRWLNLGLIFIFIFAALGYFAGQPSTAQAMPSPQQGPSQTLADLPAEGQAALARLLGKHDPQYSFQTAPDGFSAAQAGLGMLVSDSGFMLTGEQGEWGLTLTGLGEQDLPTAVPTVSENMLRLQHGSVQEWFANTPLGLEHGFTLASPPSGKESAQPLTLVLSQRGSLTASVNADRLGLSVGRQGAAPVYQYDGLVALDAAGKSLQTWFEVMGSQVLVRVEDQNAAYPILIDPWVHSARLVSSDLQTYDEFSTSIAVEGSTVVVGAPRFDRGGHTFTGQVYVFQKPQQGWSDLNELAVLTPTDWSPNNGAFGDDVAICDDTIYVLDPTAMLDGSLVPEGAVYVYRRPATGWKDMTQTARLTFGDGPSDYLTNYGVALAVNHEALFVGAPSYHIPGTDDTENQGAVYVFVKPIAGWVDAQYTALITSPDWNLKINDHDKRFFGASLAVDEDALVVGAPEYYLMEDRSHGGWATIYSGVVYVYKRPTQGWLAISQPDGRLTNDDEDAYSFGQTVDIQGDTIAASANLWQETTPYPNWEKTDKWRVYVFARPSSGWTTSFDSARLEQTDGVADDWFGMTLSYHQHPVRISGDMVAVGCLACDKGSTADAGAVYVFSKPQQGWELGPDVVNETAKIWSREPKTKGFFGATLALDGGSIYTSQPSFSDQEGDGKGAVYVLETGYLRAVNDGPTQLGSKTHFRALGSLGGATTYTWDFGDGKSGVGSVIDHQYTSAGEYTASVKATNGSDQYLSSTKVEIINNPVPEWTQANEPGFGTTDNTSVSALAFYQQTLFAGTSNNNGAQLWKNGLDNLQSAKSGGIATVGWTQAINPGFGNPNNIFINALYPFGGRLYASTVNETQGGEIWFTRGNSLWEKAVSGGFVDATNGEVTQFAAFDNQLYAGTWSYTAAHGAEIWRSSSGIDTWKPVERNGFGKPDNAAIVVLTPFNGHLYAGTFNSTSGGEVWRTADGTHWTQVNQTGFGGPDHPSVSSMAEFGGKLYVSLFGRSGTALEVWRCQACDGGDWQAVEKTGFGNNATRGMNGLKVAGDVLYLTVGNSLTGLQVWYTRDGMVWNPTVLDGFGDAANIAPYYSNSLAVLDDRLWVGTWNTTTGGQLWSGATAPGQSSGHTLFLPLLNK